MLHFIKIFILILPILYICPVFALSSSWEGIDEAKVRIISPSATIGEKKTIYLGLEYKLQKGWKTYWHSPGEGGYPQTLNWQNSINVSSIEILWPTPKHFNILGIKSIGYENEVVFPLKVNIQDINKKSVFIFNLDFLVCKEICIPVNTNLKLILPPGIKKINENIFKIEKYLSKIPQKNNEISFIKIIDILASYNSNMSLIQIIASSDTPFIQPNVFIGNDVGLEILSPKYSFSIDRKKIEANLYYDKNIFENKEGINLDVVFSDQKESTQYSKNIIPSSNTGLSDFFLSKTYIYLIAIIGGFILNLMPCVLPVLSIKLLSVLNLRNNTSTGIRRSMFITSFGIITSFLFLSLGLLAIRLSGKNIGWGMQFQEPIFLMTIFLILFFFSINLFGFFEFKTPVFSRHIINTSNNNSFLSDFFNGFFVTILATPCTAPFVGTAVAAAFTQSNINMILIFFFMGLGLSIPYLLTGLFPKIIAILPKPGSWMIKLKYFMGFLLILTLLWILSILLNHFNYIFVIASIIVFSIILYSFKYLKQLKFIVVFTSVIVFFIFNFFPFMKKFSQNDYDLYNFININLEDLIKNNDIVFVDITADWCATCQYNKFNVINSSKVKKLFNDNNVIIVTGDWTKPSIIIQEYLKDFQQFGIPFNVMYNQKYPQGIILSEILTVAEITHTLDRMVIK